MTTKYELTEKQKEALKIISGKKSTIGFYGGARSGKTFLVLRYQILRRLILSGTTGVFFRQHNSKLDTTVLLQTLPAVFESLDFKKDRDYKINKQLNLVTFKNQSKMLFKGLDIVGGGEGNLGFEASDISFDECSEMQFNVVSKVSSRAAENKGLQPLRFYMCNPPQKSHWYYKIFISKELKFSDDEVISLRMNPSDNEANLSEQYLKYLKSMPEELKARFYDGIFLDTVIGGVYQKELYEAELGKRISENIIYDFEYPINVVMDIGRNDLCAIWFCQFLKEEIRFIDFYQNRFESLKHYLEEIFKRYQKIGTIYLPHDSANHDFKDDNTVLQKIGEEGRKRGYEVYPLSRPKSVAGQIYHVRENFNKCRFNNVKCSEGLDMLRQYKYEEFPDGEFSELPEHKRPSHAADAFRYAIQAYLWIGNYGRKKEEPRDGKILLDLIEKNRDQNYE